MAWTGKNNKGKVVTLLNPREKAEKYSTELRANTRFTNTGEEKFDDNGKSILTNTQKAYRSGYLDARKDSANAWKSKHPEWKSKAKKRKK